jgi:NitT/TauT family transport system permease protein
VLNRVFNSIWGRADVFFLPVRRRYWVDLIVLLAGCGLIYSGLALGQLWYAPKRALIDIDLSPWALPKYTLFSMMRGILAYFVSLAFTLVVAPIAARSPRAEKLIVPFLDICQSVPVFGFMPGLVLIFAGLSNGHNIGLELAAILMIFTSQAWNMAFSVYYSIKAIPAELGEAATHYGFTKWQRFKWLELPCSMNGLMWNSMMSMAGAWFFLMITESFQLGTQDYRLPGVGSYMSVAVERGDKPAMAWALLAMLIMIVMLDQLVWRPALAWSLRFRMDEGSTGEEEVPWFLALLRRSRLMRLLRRFLRSRRGEVRRQIARIPPAAAQRPRWMNLILSAGAIAALAIASSVAAWRLFGLFAAVGHATWLDLLLRGGATLGRVLAATVLATLWTLPVGLAIGLSPRLSRWLQPVVQIVAAFPAPMLFSVTITLLLQLGLGLSGGSILLMLLGGQWYLLFNIIAGASAIPADLREAAVHFGLPRWQRFKRLYLPAVFPYLVTGWVTCAGGSWNASIITEYFNLKAGAVSTFGLGSAITEAAAAADFPLLAASVLLMVVIVIAFNRLVWRPLYELAETRYALAK